MTSKLRNVFNIYQTCSFWDTIADIYVKKYETNFEELANVLFLLPNRRACQSLTEAFVRKRGLKPTILPKITPIAEIDDDFLFFNGFDNSEIYKSDTQVISSTERLFLFTRLILSKPADFGLKQISTAQAFSLAVDLASLIDTANNQGLSFEKLDDLVPEKYATHWQETLRLLKIITVFWPEILKERNAIDLSEFRNLLLDQQAKIWSETKPSTNVVAAGITASFPAIIKILDSIKNLPNGEIYFYQIDLLCDDNYWQAVDESHPQFEIKSLLELLKIKRDEVVSLELEHEENREKLISEIMRPSYVTDEWRNVENSFDADTALSKIHIINCKTQRDEALAIALKLREVLNEPEKTGALITYDRNLARRVASELKRFGINIDDTAGIPLNLVPIGIFFNQIIEFAEDMESEVKFVSLLKNPFCLYNNSPALFRQDVYRFELNLRKKHQHNIDENFAIFDEIKQVIIPLCQALKSDKTDFKSLLELHINVAEKLATSNETEGARLLWRGDAGKKFASLMTKLLESADTLGMISGKDYRLLINELLSVESVRPSFGTHPRLKILGPIEAHLAKFDYVILGEFNEGTWPKAVQADMWMSRPMKRDFGFNLPEKEIGILGADLCGFLASPNVILTRAERVDGVPMKKSRWLLRLETLLKAIHKNVLDIEDCAFENWVLNVDMPQKYVNIQPPAPCPPLSARPRKLSASGVDLLITDPYSVFAKYILGLYPLDELDIKLNQRDYGTLIHGIIEEFNNLYPASLPENALELLLGIGEKHFASAKMDKNVEAFWRAKFEKTAEWIIEQEKDYRSMIDNVTNEVQGKIHYDFPNGAFTFTAKADRIDLLKSGELNILDYKTGQIPSKKQVMSGHMLQLPLEGLIARKGGFPNIYSRDVNSLIYWQLGKSVLNITAEEDNLLDKTEEYLLRLVNIFDMPSTPYHSRPIPKFVPKNTDYEHLSRIKEWSVQDDGELYE